MTALELEVSSLYGKRIFKDEVKKIIQGLNELHQIKIHLIRDLCVPLRLFDHHRGFEVLGNRIISECKIAKNA